MIIYKVCNVVNGKVYIGQTEKSLSARKSQHIYETFHNVDKMYFHKAIRKHGKENFIWEIIDQAQTREELDFLEKCYIKQFGSLGGGYNLTEGGGGFCRKHSEETKKMLSELFKGRKPWNTGKAGTYHHTEEAKKNMGDARKGEKNHFYGKHHTEEAKKKMKGRCMSEETKKKLSEIHKKRFIKYGGRKVTEETKRKLSETNKGQVPWCKGKTYEEMYGIEKAIEMKRMRSEKMKETMKKRGV
jgi:group I intron endonuclease